MKKRQDHTPRIHRENNADCRIRRAAFGLETEVEAKTKLPQRVLGRTGVKVPIIAFGCGSRFLMYGVRTRRFARSTT